MQQATKRLRVKVCGLREPSNIREVAELEIAYAGFIFYPLSPRCVVSSLDVAALLPPSIVPVGVFVNETHAAIMQTVRKYHLRAVQLHGEELPEQCLRLQSEGLEVIKSFAVKDSSFAEKTKAYEGRVKFFLFDTKTDSYGGSGVAFNWDLLAAYKGQTPFFLSGGIDLKSSSGILALDHPRMVGVDINSRFESAPAMKDVRKIAAFVKELSIPTH